MLAIQPPIGRYRLAVTGDQTKGISDALIVVVA